MDTLEDVYNIKALSVRGRNTKAISDDNPEETFYRLLDALSVKASSWFTNHSQRPQLDETALSCLGMVVEEFMHHQLTPLIDIDHKTRNIPLLKERLTEEDLESGSLPYLVKKYKKKHRVIEEGQVKPRPKLSDDLAAFYKQEFTAEKRPPSMIEPESTKKKRTKVEKHDVPKQVQEEPIRIKQDPSSSKNSLSSYKEEDLQDNVQSISGGIKLEETQAYVSSPKRRKSSKQRKKTTDFFDNLNKTAKGNTSRKKSAKKSKANKASIF